MDISQNMFNSYPDIVTVYQLKEMLAVGYNKAYELVKTGAIESIKVGKSYRITKNSVINFVLNC